LEDLKKFIKRRIEHVENRLKTDEQHRLYKTGYWEGKLSAYERVLDQIEIAGEAKKSGETVVVAHQKKPDCPHLKTFSYNHGYHTICEDCGEEV
jgi:hypothetical protein